MGIWGSLASLLVALSTSTKGKKLKNKSSEPFFPGLTVSCVANLWFLTGARENEEIFMLLESVCTEVVLQV